MPKQTVSMAFGQRRQFHHLTITILAALGILAALAIGIYGVVDALIDGQKQIARTVNIAGRQRMLSQRIASYAAELAMIRDEPQSDELARQMAAAVDLMESSHRALSFGSPELGIPAARSAALTSIYQDGPYQLDTRVAAFIGLARTYLALAPGARASAAILPELLATAHEPLLDSLDAAVKQLQVDSETAIFRLRLGLLGMLAAILLILVAEWRFLLRPVVLEITAAQAQLMDLALTDPLTGCRNRRSLMELAEHEFVRTRRTRTPLSVMMLDIDHFKRINDTWGHAVGDEAILALARILIANVRANDLLGRIGGEEFALALPDTPLPNAIVAAEKLRAMVAERPMSMDAQGKDKRTVSMTISIGVSEVEPTDPDFRTILDRADQALYRAKQGGRNRVVAWQPAGQAEPRSNPEAA